MTAILRSMLFIPGDNDRKLAKADGCGADAVILDLEDSVSPSHKQIAREKIAAFLLARPPGKRGGTEIWVRINPLDDPLALHDLAAIVSGAPDGIMLPKSAGEDDIAQLGFYLDALEVQAGLARACIGIVPVASETPAATLHLAGRRHPAHPRLRAMTWGAEDLSASLGASTNQDELGGWALTYRLARSLALLAAHAAGVQAIETLYVDFRDEAGLRASCRAARAEGFTGRLAIHPAQVAAINESFTPSEAECAHALRVIAAFDAAQGAGVAALDGKMIDIPHLKQARRIVEEKERSSF